MATGTIGEIMHNSSQTFRYFEGPSPETSCTQESAASVLNIFLVIPLELNSHEYALEVCKCLVAFSQHLPGVSPQLVEIFSDRKDIEPFPLFTYSYSRQAFAKICGQTSLVENLCLDHFPVRQSCAKSIVNCGTILRERDVMRQDDFVSLRLCVTEE